VVALLVRLGIGGVEVEAKIDVGRADDTGWPDEGSPAELTDAMELLRIEEEEGGERIVVAPEGAVSPLSGLVGPALLERRSDVVEGVDRGLGSCRVGRMSSPSLVLDMTNRLLATEVPNVTVEVAVIAVAGPVILEKLNVPRDGL
jgi:hypothetical protein